MEKIKKLVALLLLCTFFAFSSMPLTPFDRGDRQAAHAVMSSDSIQEANTVIIDFGPARSDDIDDLRRGEGKVFNKISKKIEELKSTGEVSDNIQPIIVIFKKKNIDRGVLG